jgi:hypothetical protein
MTTILATSTCSAEAVAEVQNKIASSGLGAETVIATAAAQKGLAAAYLAIGTAMYGRTAMDYYLAQVLLDRQVDDPLTMLSYLLACEAASTCEHKYQTDAVIGGVVENATLLLDELMGLRPMPLNRPSDDQMAVLLEQIATARAANGLDPLPPLLKN